VGVGSGSGGYSAVASFLVHGGDNNVISGNIVDLGTGSHNGTVIWYYGGNPTDPGMNGDTFTNNIVISNFTGGLNETFFGRDVAYNEATNDPAGHAYTIHNNAYWNYAPGGSVFSNGNTTSDSGPIHEDAQLSGPTYTIAGGSPVFNSPMNFQPIVGGWGPPGFTISNSNRSSP
jgi:hypothetical protein